MDILIVGSGFTGAVIAHQLAKSNKINQITVIDERNHIGGNCFTEKDSKTGIIIHRYGPHIFHTSNERVWKFVNKFDDFWPYQHRVKAKYKNRIYSLPINLHTINQFFNKSLNPKQAEKYINKIALKIKNPRNFEEQALAFIGEKLYKAFLYGYTKKQWGCEPKYIPAYVLKRLPIRFNYDDSYHHSRYSGIPQNGYSTIIEKLLDHKKIKLILSTLYTPHIEDTKFYKHIFYTGPIDKFFNYKFGRLGYRTVKFKEYRTIGDYQGCSQINYTDENIEHTRIIEHKYFMPWTSFDNTIYHKEYSFETGPKDIPYYPKRLEEDIDIYNKYEMEAKKLDNYTFIGRLAKYQYLDMHQVIDEALNVSEAFLRRL